MKAKIDERHAEMEAGFGTVMFGKSPAQNKGNQPSRLSPSACLGLSKYLVDIYLYNPVLVCLLAQDIRDTSQGHLGNN